MAYAVTGDGPGLVAPAWWVSHLELDWLDPTFRSFWESIGEGHALVRYDGPGVGMSDREVRPENLTIEHQVALLSAVLEELAMERVTLIGGSSGGCAAVAFAARFPERVDRLLLYGAYAQGSAITSPAAREAIIAAVRSHWGLGSRILADLFLGEVDSAAQERFARFQRAAASAETAAALLEAIHRNDVRAELNRVRAPTVVVHRRADRAIPYEQGRALAAAIPGARLIPLDGSAHLPWAGDAESVTRALRSFLWPHTEVGLAAGEPAEALLSDREREVLPSPGTSSPVQQPDVGTTLTGQSGDRYVVVSRIGRGGTACVYDVMAADGSNWAAKVLSDHRFPVDDAMRARFAREIEQLARVDHPHVLRFRDRAAFAGEPVLIFELAARSLHDHLAGWHSAVPLPAALRWLEQAFDGVAELHRLGLVHRDLSPKNLMLRADGSLAVGDLGTVRHLDDATITQDHLALGSLIYISAQQFDDAHDANPRDDVFSLGQTAWQLLAGRRPVGNVPAIDTVRPHLPAGLAELVERARDDNPSRRPANAGVALSTLRKIIAADRAAVETPTPGARSSGAVRST